MLGDLKLVLRIVDRSEIIRSRGKPRIQLQRLLIARGLNTPMIFVTAFPEEGVRARVLDAGAVGFLGKPFDEDNLIDCLRIALGDQAGRKP